MEHPNGTLLRKLKLKLSHKKKGVPQSSSKEICSPNPVYILDSCLEDEGGIDTGKSHHTCAKSILKLTNYFPKILLFPPLITQVLEAPS